jgi:NhaP-type Na+/H+ or K+/H+ antiporter
MFVFFGSIPWKKFLPSHETPSLGLWQLTLFLILVLLFRRIPIVLAMKRFIPDVRTYREALFCGHFGPMGVGALFLAMEARGELEPGNGVPQANPELGNQLGNKEKAIYLVWPVICFVVLGSTIVHGLSTVAISLGGSITRKRGERAPLLGQETDALAIWIMILGMGRANLRLVGLMKIKVTKFRYCMLWRSKTALF